MGWKIKWAKDGLKTLVPFQPFLRAAKRKWKPYATNPKNDANAFDQGLRQIKLLQESGANLKDATALEVGAGWKPIVPLLFHAAGCRPFFLTDQETLMDGQTLRSAAAYLRSRSADIASALGVTEESIRKHYDRSTGESFQDALRAYDLNYLAPYDINDIASGSVDVIVSRAVFEHISEKLLEELLGQWRRILKPGGRMCHCIDNSDHWEHLDKSVSRINFLKYPDALVPILGINVQNFQNRLRHYEYRDIFRRAGFAVETESGEVDDAALRDARTMKLCARYRGVPPEDLAILTSYFVVRKVEN